MNRLPVAPGDRNVPWRDVCPNTWRLEPVKYLCSINRRALPETTDPDTGFRYLDISGVDSEGNWVASELMRFADAPSRARRVVQDGDVIVSTVRTYLRAIAHIDKVEEPLICSTGFAVLSANGAVDSKFLAHWTRSVYFVDEIVARSVGVSYPAVNASDLGNIPCPLLPFDQQRAIGRFLDRETARIDALIEKKRRQIELLHEKRAALISHAVTKGLDPNAPMKDSGVDWLGHIPAHWEVKRLKRLAILRSGEAITAEEIEQEGEYPVYGGNGLRGYTSSYTHEGDRVLIGRQGALCGCINYATGRFWASEHAVVVTPTVEVQVLWLGELLRAMNLNQHSQSAAQPGLAVDNIASLHIPVPPVDDQRSIAALVDRTQKATEALVQRIGCSIDLLREYRTALISAAVTGKIDVREDAV